MSWVYIYIWNGLVLLKNVNIKNVIKIGYSIVKGMECVIFLWCEIYVVLFFNLRIVFLLGINELMIRVVVVVLNVEVIVGSWVVSVVRFILIVICVVVFILVYLFYNIIYIIII